MISEFLIRRLGEDSLFPEVGGQVAVSLGDGIKGGLSKVAQGGSAASGWSVAVIYTCLLYTSDAADDTPCVDLGGRRIIKKIFFKQKTAYEIPLRLVGSEMCIRDRL